VGNVSQFGVIDFYRRSPAFNILSNGETEPLNVFMRQYRQNKIIGNRERNMVKTRYAVMIFQRQPS
jgi:hypothetical protein